VIQAAPSGPWMTPCGAERHLAHSAGRGVQDAERAAALAGVPDKAVGPGSDVMGAAAGGNIVDADIGRLRGGGGGRREKSGEKQERAHRVSLGDRGRNRKAGSVAF